MTTDPVRARWTAGEPALIAWLLLDGPLSAETVAAAGFDAAVVDLQHGAATLDRLADVLRAIGATPASPFVRVAGNDPAELMRVLDLGARGVICPMVGSGAEAELFVAACRYPPVGIRSYGPVRATFGRGRDQTEGANETVLLFAMIETADGLANLDDIASTPGLDGLFVGPTDLSLALDLETVADFSDPGLLKALDAVVDAAARHEILAGIHAPSPPTAAAESIARGFRLVSCAVDTDLLAGSAAAVLRGLRPV